MIHTTDTPRLPIAVPVLPACWLATTTAYGNGGNGAPTGAFGPRPRTTRVNGSTTKRPLSRPEQRSD